MVKDTTKENISSSLAREDDGNIQITFSIVYPKVEEAKRDALEEITKEAEIPGFRKGKAPVSEVEKKVKPNQVVEKALSKILPQAFANAIEKFKIRPIVYPKFEVIKAKENEDWQVRAVTCEMPEISLGDYKKLLAGSSKAKDIWTPEKGKPEEKPKEKTNEEKEQEVIKILLDSIKVKVPKLLINEEVDGRLSSLLERIEKLGLTLEGYLSSVGKTPESLRAEYEIQAKNTICLDLILQKIAEEEKIEIKDTQIDEVIKVSSGDPKLSEKLNTPEQRRFISSILKKRAALESLTALL